MKKTQNQEMEELKRRIVALEAQVAMLQQELIYHRPLQPSPLYPRPWGWNDFTLEQSCVCGQGLHPHICVVCKD